MIENRREKRRIERKLRRREQKFQKRQTLMSRLRSLLGLNNPKIFCVGRNKTGTTSLEAALKMLGYRVGRQRDAELLFEVWGRRDFRSLIAYCHTAEAFQDVPFSHDYTFQAMDPAFPGSKFILTVRDSPEQWYESLIRFHSKRLNKGRIPTPDDLRSDPYVYNGWLWRQKELVFGPEEHTLFQEELSKSHYVRHEALIVDYFRHRQSDLLVLNLADQDSMRRLCAFLGHSWNGQQMPLLNKSS